MNLFDAINSTFFNPLASNSSNRINSDALLAVYDAFEHEISYKIDRSAVRDAVAGYLLDSHLTADENQQYATANDFANALLRKFCDCGWLTEETDDTTYERMIIMTDRGIALAEFLQTLIKPPKEEYSSYIFNIYNRLKNYEQWKNNPYVNALKEVYKNAKKLSNSLKKLSTSIRSIIEKMVREETLESLTENLLSYCDGDFIKEYSRLVKQQNIHIYRTEIRSRLEKMRRDPDLYDLIVIGCYDEENPNNEADAEQKVHDMFDSAIRFLTDDYDKIMNDIKKKINIYFTLAIGRARFLMNNDVSKQGCIEQVLKFMLDEYKELDGNDLLPDEFTGLFTLNTQSYIDTSSLRFPTKQKKVSFTGATEAPPLSDEDKQRALEQQRREAYDPYSRRAMKSYVSNLMGERREISAREFPMTKKGDILAAAAAAAYAEENGFEIVILDGYIVNDSMLLHDFIIRRK